MLLAAAAGYHLAVSLTLLDESAAMATPWQALEGRRAANRAQADAADRALASDAMRQIPLVVWPAAGTDVESLPEGCVDAWNPEVTRRTDTLVVLSERKEPDKRHGWLPPWRRAATPEQARFVVSINAQQDYEHPSIEVVTRKFGNELSRHRLTLRVRRIEILDRRTGELVYHDVRERTPLTATSIPARDDMGAVDEAIDGWLGSSNSRRAPEAYADALRAEATWNYEAERRFLSWLRVVR